jgi:predicted nucleic acid-binding protein
LSYLIDTCILIDHLRGYKPAYDWLSKTLTLEPAGKFYYSAITMTELWAGMPLRQEQLVQRLLSTMECLGVDEAIARTAGEYVRKWRPGHGVEIPDAILAATAKESGAVLVTINRRHFPMDDLQVLVPYTY